MSLGALQVINYLVPLIVIPILLERIGLTNYGLISLAQGLMVILTSVADLGFNLTGTRQISTRQKGQHKVIASRILFIRVISCTVCFILLSCSVYLIADWYEQRILILLSFPMVIGQAFLPTWYYQGVQRMGHLATLTFVSRGLYLSMILIIVKEPGDYIYVNLLNGLAWVFAAGLGILLMVRNLGNLPASGRKGWLLEMRQNIPIFLSNVTSTSYRNGGIILAGFILSPGSLGVYGVLDKIIQLSANSFTVIFRSLLPAISQVAVKRKTALVPIFRKIFEIGLPIVLAGMMTFYFFGAQVLSFFSKELTVGLVDPFIGPMCLIPLMMLLNLPLGLSMVSLDFRRAFLQYSATSLIIFLISGMLLGLPKGLTGILAAIVIAEGCAFIVGIVLLRSNVGLTSKSIQ